MEVMDRYAARPIRVLLEEDGRIRAMNGAALVDLAPYESDVWYTVSVEVDVPAGRFDLSIDGATVLSGADFTETVHSIERVSFRTGEYRTEPTRRMNPEPGPEDLPGADDPVPAVVFHLDDVTVTQRPSGVGYRPSLDNGDDALRWIAFRSCEVERRTIGVGLHSSQPVRFEGQGQIQFQ
jgi:hypothetical protein